MPFCPDANIKQNKLFFKTSIVYQAVFVIMNAVAEVAELVDAPDSKSGGGDTMWVRFPPSVPLRELFTL